jgi:hypothetical protein
MVKNMICPRYKKQLLLLRGRDDNGGWEDATVPDIAPLEPL